MKINFKSRRYLNEAIIFLAFKNNEYVSLSVALELVPLMGEKNNFKSPLQNKILVPLRILLRIADKKSHPFCMGVFLVLVLTKHC